MKTLTFLFLLLASSLFGEEFKAPQPIFSDYRNGNSHFFQVSFVVWNSNMVYEVEVLDQDTTSAVGFPVWQTLYIIRGLDDLFPIPIYSAWYNFGYYDENNTLHVRDPQQIVRIRVTYDPFGDITP